MFFLCIAAIIALLADYSFAMRIPWDKMNLAVSGGWGKYDMPNLAGTTYSYDAGAYPVEFSGHYFSTIGGGPAYSLEMGYDISKRISLGGAFAYLYGSKIYNDYLTFMDNYFNRQSPLHNREFQVSLLAFEFKAEYIITSKPLRLSIGPGIAWLHGNARLPLLIPLSPPNIGLTHRDFSASGFGAELSGAASYKLGRGVSLRTESGYRYFRTGQLKDENGNRWNKMRINFSGLYLSAGLLLEL